MKKFFCILLFTLFAASLSFSQPASVWVKQTNSPTNYNLKRVYFVDSLYGWITADSGMVFRTTNGGQNWVQQFSNSTYNFVDIFFINRNRGWALAWYYNYNYYGSFIFSTTNGGVNWSYYLYPDTMVYANVIYFTTLNNGYLGLTFPQPRVLMYTTNGGVNWSPAEIAQGLVSNFPITRIKFVNQTTGIAVGGYIDIAGVVWKTTNAGLNWVSQPVGAEPLWDLCIWDANNIFSSGGDFEYGISVSHTTNLGSNWTYSWLEIFGMGLSIAFRTQNEGWIASGFSELLVYTTDAGSRWQEIPSPDSTMVTSIVFANQYTGWAVGEHGTILKYNAGSSGVNNQNTKLEDFSLVYNYPNPFNSSTTIRYQVLYPSLVTIEVFDVNGKFIKKLKEEYQNSGVYKFKFYADDLPSGVYFYKVRIKQNYDNREFVNSGKMVLVK
ncbi:MAG: YCF48-related protein [Ignavibacteria bacterium]|nr:YCF48-related protein [Ignavibacteria bacterium]